MEKLPQHIGIICDGNRRFAQALGEVVWMGHEYGANKIEDILDWCVELGINELTLWLFSTENLQRPKEELEALFRIGEKLAKDFVKNPKVHKNRVKLSILGDISIFPESLRAAINEALDATKDYGGLKLNIAAGYGGRQEILTAVKKIAALVKEGKIDPAKIDEQLLEAHMYSASVPNVDLVIRTSGEKRMSGFLMWKTDYAEYYFTDKYWPEFEKEDLLRAIIEYSERKRRFGV